MTPSQPLDRSASLPYVLPFGVFLLFLALGKYLPISLPLLYALWVIVLAAILWIFSRPVLDLRPKLPLASLGVGILVFILWVLPDVVFPAYRDSVLFQNSLSGSLGSSLPPSGRSDAVVLFLRAVRAIVIVPIVEELFWRAWLMRWLVNPRFHNVPLGAYNAMAFWVTAVLFASEHGPYWDVGLIAGVIYNAWMIRTRSLADCIWAHAVTNACLSGYVLYAGKWQYW